MKSYRVVKMKDDPLRGPVVFRDEGARSQEEARGVWERVPRGGVEPKVAQMRSARVGRDREGLLDANLARNWPQKDIGKW